MTEHSFLMLDSMASFSYNEPEEQQHETMHETMQPTSLAANIYAPPFQHTPQHEPKQNTNQETETDTESDGRPGQGPVGALLLQRGPRAFLPLARLRGGGLAVRRAARLASPRYAETAAAMVCRSPVIHYRDSDARDPRARGA